MSFASSLPRVARPLAFVAAGALVASVAFVSYRWSVSRASVFPLASSSSVVVHESPNVLLAVRDLARLESAELHMERVMDLRSHQTQLFGLVEADDAILLVAVGDVTAGVDLTEIHEGDVSVDASTRAVAITLPPARVLSSRLDNDKTYVHSRRTDLLAARKESLESEARAQAERALAKAAEDTGVLKRADANARRTVEQLVRALGFHDVTIRTRDGADGAG